jgi:Putative peptidoglycan binding domain
VITRYNKFKESKLNEIAGIYDGYYGLTLQDFKMSDLYQITALSAQSTIEIFNGNETFQDALLPTSSLWNTINVGYKSCTSGMMTVLQQSTSQNDVEVYQDLLYLKENKDKVKKAAKVIKQDINNYKSYLNTILPDQIKNLKKIKIERSDADFTDASSPIDVVQKEILIKTRKYRNPIYMIGIFLTNLMGNYQPSQTFIGLSDFVKKHDISTFHSIFGESNQIDFLSEFEDVISVPLKKLSDSIQDTYYHMRYYDLIPGADNSWRATVLVHCLELLIDNCILIEEEKISSRLALKFSKELQSFAKTKTWIGYTGIQEGSIVKTIQKILQAMGLFKGGITGKFGELTHGAIIRFQENAINEDGKKLTVDGRIGKQTRWALENLNDSYLPYVKSKKEENKEKSQDKGKSNSSNSSGEPKKSIII